MKKHFANVATLANALCGVAAIICAVQGLYEFAVRLIFFALFFDAIDGTLARAFGSFPWGKIFDRCADRISQAAAPAFLLAAFWDWSGIAILASVTMVSAALIRLLQKNAPEHFSGLPLSIAAFAALGSVMAESAAGLFAVIIFGILACVQRVRYPRRLTGMQKFPGGSLWGGLSGKTWIARVLLLVGFVYSPIAWWPLLGFVLLACAGVYTFVGPLIERAKGRS